MQWYKYKNNFVPAWIGFGDASPIIKDPWTGKESPVQFYLYYLTTAGIKSIEMESEVWPLHLLPRNQKENNAGEVYFIATDNGRDFVKDYFLYKLGKEIENLGPIYFADFFDLVNIRGLPIYTQNSGLFFHENGVNGDQNYLVLRRDKEQINNTFDKLLVEKLNLSYINAVYEDFIIFQSPYRFGFYHSISGEKWLRASKVNIRRRKLIPLKNQVALYLPLAEAPGLSSEIYFVKNNKLISDPNFRFWSINGCEEIGYFTKSEEDYIAFSCLEQNRIFFEKIQNIHE